MIPILMLSSLAGGESPDLDMVLEGVMFCRVHTCIRNIIHISYCAASVLYTIWENAMIFFSTAYTEHCCESKALTDFVT